MCATNEISHDPSRIVIVSGTVPVRTYLIAASLAVLVAGCAAALALYVTAEDEQAPSAETALLLSPGSSKTYVRDLQRFGGKSAVLFDEFMRWFDGLWRGKALGRTVALLSALLALALYLAARQL
jgi:hypothetical protein